ncbi:hypothetical protein GCM10009592_14480 [Brachybacterium rhamnosum]|uniref:Uncharacterized protein n=1 Tax=Brachybacterium rhamnosum TaxID=173361 RepID=A0ABW4PX30_9MICO
MTTLYRPVLIETAEQAEALPVGTVAHIDVFGGPRRYAAVRTPGGDWYLGGREYHEHTSMVGWTALMPVEAEEETQDDATFAEPNRVLRRLVTPWGPA